ncbi:hypothetical protein BZA70DRAFT_197860 [Myxozyma melibiosi]|uniref:RING-type E3 ubiquitin transferase n=1 Tax=Myxozyma melibiosi TaxID=54550 RepID=A0ABR1F2C1_9ASCO
MSSPALFPSAGLRLAPTAAASRPATQVFHLKLSESALEDVLRAAEHDPSSLKLLLGDNPSIRIAGHLHSLSTVPEQSLVDIYAGSKDSAKYVGKLSHRLAVDNQSLDSSRIKSSVREKDSLRTTLLDPAPSRASSRALSSSPRITPASPHLPSSLHVAAKSRPTLAPSSPRNSLRSLATRLTHFLALSASASPNQLAARTKAPLEDIKALLAEYAVPIGDASTDDCQYTLTDAAYRDIIRPWEWRAYSPAERTKAIGRAEEAYERLQIPKDDPVWLNLVEPALRNSGESEDSVPVLKLDDLPAPPPATAPAPLPLSSSSAAKDVPVKRAGGAILKTKMPPTKKVKEDPAATKKEPNKASTKTKSRPLKREREESGTSSESDVDLMSRRKPEVTKKRKAAPDTTASATATPTQSASEPMQRSRSESTSSSGTKSPRKPSPLGASPPITAADLAEPKSLSRQVDNYDEYELRKMARRFKTLYEEYRRLYQEVKQYESIKDGTAKKQQQQHMSLSIGNEHQYLAKRDRLLKLHHKLEDWKTTLWRAAPRFM